MAEIVLGPENEAPPDALVEGPTVVPLEMVPFPMLVADGNGRVLAVNSRWTELTGLSRDASLGTGWLDVLEPVAPLEDLVSRVAAGEVGHGDACEWAAVGGRRTQWWVASEELAGERLVGLAVGIVEADPVQADVEPDPESPRTAPASTVVEPDPHPDEVGASVYAEHGPAEPPAASPAPEVPEAAATAVAPEPPPAEPPAAEPPAAAVVETEEERVLRELPALIRSFDALLVALDRVLEHWASDLAPVGI